MVDLTNKKTLLPTCFYSFLTSFFHMPSFSNDYPEQCPAGFLLGFTVSVFLWIQYGRHYAK